MLQPQLRTIVFVAGAPCHQPRSVTPRFRFSRVHRARGGGHFAAVLPKRHVSAPLPLAALAPWPSTRFDMGHSTSKKNARSGKSGFEAWNHKRKAPKPTNIKQRQTSRALGPPMVRNHQTSSPVVHNSGVLGGSPDESVKESIVVDHGARSVMFADHGWA